MKLIIPAIAVLVVLVSSCQKEINIRLNGTNDDSTVRVTPMFRVAQVHPQISSDSQIYIFHTLTKNDQRSVIEYEIDPAFPGDTTITLFTYNQQDQLINIKVTSSTDPTVESVTYKFTWMGTRLVKVVGETLGQFAASFDYTYTPSGSNTTITSAQVPSLDYIDQSVEVRMKHKLTVNAQFLGVEEQWINHTHLPQSNPSVNSHDTTNFVYSYSGRDLTSVANYRSAADTNSSVGWPTNIFKDTAIGTYTRNSAGGNLSDSLRKIYGNEIYTLMHFNMLDLSLTTTWPFFSNIRQVMLFYSKPFNSFTQTARFWWNGIYDNVNSFTNVEWEKSDNSFDAMGRLIRADIYEVLGGPNVEYSLRITYY